MKIQMEQSDQVSHYSPLHVFVDIDKRDSFITLYGIIVRPVKRDWAVLSKDTPVDISILKSV